MTHHLLSYDLTCNQHINKRYQTKQEAVIISFGFKVNIVTQWQQRNKAIRIKENRRHLTVLQD